MSGGAKDSSVCLWAARAPRAPFTGRVAPGRQIFLPDGARLSTVGKGQQARLSYANIDKTLCTDRTGVGGKGSLYTTRH